MIKLYFYKNINIFKLIFYRRTKSQIKLYHNNYMKTHFLKKFFTHHIKLYSLLLLMCCTLFIVPMAEAQDESEQIKMLNHRIDSLQKQVNDNTFAIQRNKDTINVHTRRFLEASKTGGFALGDVEGNSLTIYGFIQADLIHDFKQINPASADKMQPSYIPTNNGTVGSTAFSIRQSRFGFRSTTLIDKKLLKTLFEIDLFNPDGSATPRLRHAYAEYGRWGFGQFWSNWMDMDTWPNVFDYWGPNAMIFSRTVQLRYTQPLGHGYVARFSLENPGGDIIVPDSVGTNIAQIPNLTGTLRKDWGQSHLQFSTVLHPITYTTNPNTEINQYGYGAALYGLIYVSKLDNFSFQAAYGNGIANWSEDIGGLGYDGQFGPNNELKLLPYIGVFAYYDHFWSPKLSSTIGYSYLQLDNETYEPGTNLHATAYSSMNLIYYVNSSLKIGPELLYGSRTNVDGSFGDDFRLSISGNMRF
jgi:hypothetical protein